MNLHIILILHSKNFWNLGRGVAQLTARLLPISEGPGSNPVIGNFCWTIIYCLLFVEKMKMKEKEAWNGQKTFQTSFLRLGKGKG